MQKINSNIQSMCWVPVHVLVYVNELYKWQWPQWFCGRWSWNQRIYFEKKKNICWSSHWKIMNSNSNVASIDCWLSLSMGDVEFYNAKCLLWYCPDRGFILEPGAWFCLIGWIETSTDSSVRASVCLSDMIVGWVSRGTRFSLSDCLGIFWKSNICP